MFIKSKLSIALSLAWPCLIATAQAQQQTDTSLPPVQITGERKDVPPATQPDIKAARKNLSQVAGGVSLLDNEVAKEGRVSTLNEALKLAPGVFVESRAGASDARLSIRGSGLGVFDSGVMGTVLLQDGVDDTPAGLRGYYQLVNPAGARYIEVYRGANALQYGAATLGGAINFVSPTGYTASPFETRVEGGSFGYRRLFAQAAGVTGAQKNIDYVVSLNTSDQDGFRAHSEEKSTRFNANLGIAINRDVETRFYFVSLDTDSRFPRSLTKAELNSNPRQATPEAIENNYGMQQKTNRIANKTSFRLGDGTLEASAFYGQSDNTQSTFVIGDYDLKYSGLGLRYVLPQNLGGHQNQLTVGFKPSWSKSSNVAVYLNDRGARGIQRLGGNQESSNQVFYLEDQYNITPQLAVIGGLQHLKSERKWNDTFHAISLATFTPTDSSFDSTVSRTSPKLGLRYDVSPDLQVFGNVSGSYEPPAITDIMFGNSLALVSGISQLGLAPQKARTVELGSRGRAGGIEWDAAVYYAKVRNEFFDIESPFVPNAADTTNIPKTTHAGLELGLVAHPSKSLDWRNALLLNRFRFDNDPTFGNNYLPGVPRSYLSSELVWKSGGGLYAGANVKWSPQRFAVDLANTLYADRYAVFGLKVGKRPGSGQGGGGLGWYAEAKNLFDKKYVSSTVPLTNAAGVDSRAFSSGDGRSLFVGLEWRM